MFFTKLLSLVKRYWIPLHGITILLIAVYVRDLGVSWGSYFWKDVLMVSLTVSVLFPLGFLSWVFLSLLFVGILDTSVWWDRLFVMCVFVCAVTYYALWIIPDTKWSQRTARRVATLRLVWFMINIVLSVLAWGAMVSFGSM